MIKHLKSFNFFAGGFALSIGMIDFLRGDFKMGIVLFVLAGLNFHMGMRK